MKNSVLVILALAVTLGLGCSRDDAEKAAATARESADAAAEAARETADAAIDVAAQAGDAAETAAADAVEAMEGAADDAGKAVKEASAGMAADAVAACRSLAEKGAWEQALAVCEKAHELLPDDLGIEHALQQAQAAAK